MPRLRRMLAFTPRRRPSTILGDGAPQKPPSHISGPIMSSVQLPDFARLDDTALLSLRAQMRAELEQIPEHSAARAALVRVYDASTEEVNERARKAWASGQ
jgi:hypothetical protein